MLLKILKKRMKEMKKIKNGNEITKRTIKSQDARR